MEVKRADLLGEDWDFRFIVDRWGVGLGCFVYEKGLGTRIYICLTFLVSV